MTEEDGEGRAWESEPEEEEMIEADAFTCRDVGEALPLERVAVSNSRGWWCSCPLTLAVCDEVAGNCLIGDGVCRATEVDEDWWDTASTDWNRESGGDDGEERGELPGLREAETMFECWPT